MVQERIWRKRLNETMLRRARGRCQERQLHTEAVSGCERGLRRGVPGGMPGSHRGH